jgi:hypothetical protein
MLKSLILNNNIIENIIVGSIDSPNCVPSPADYDVLVGYKFNDELQLFLSPSMTVEEFNSIRNGHIEKLNEIVTWYTSYLTSSHYNGLAVERKDQIRTWADEIFSIVPTEIEKLNNNNSCVLSYIIPFTEILETRPNIEFEV